MDHYYNKVKENEANGVKYVKTEEEWNLYKQTLDQPQEELDANEEKVGQNYLRYGSILGKKYCNKTVMEIGIHNFQLKN